MKNRTVNCVGNLWWLLLAGLVVILALTSVVGLSSSTAGADFAPNSNLSGVSNLANCYQQNHKMAVDFVVDETASLEFGDNGGDISTPGTDPEANRIQLVNDVARTLGSLSSFAPGQIEIRADAFGTGLDFSDPYSSFSGNSPSGIQSPPVDWTPITSNSVGTITSSVSHYFTTAYGDQNTDYFQSLSAAYQNILEEANNMSATPDSVCTAVIMFTDGQMSFVNGYQPPWSPIRVENSTLQTVENIGYQDLCAAGTGLADKFRQQHIFLFTAGLSSSTAPGQSFGLLQQLAGVAPGCGTPNGTGQFFNGSVDAMVSGLLTGLVGGQALPSAPCTTSGCSQTFNVDRYTKSALVYVSTDLPPNEAGQPGSLELISPSGTVTPIPAQGGSTQLANGNELQAFVSSYWSGGSPRTQSVLALDFPNGSSTGQSTWTVHLTPNPGVDPSMTVQVNLISGVSFGPPRSGIWKRGFPATVTYPMQYNGAPLPGNEIEEQSLRAEVTFGSNSTPVAVPVTGVGQTDQFVVAVAVPMTVTSGSATVRLSGSVTLRSGDVVSADAVPDTDITVVPPHGPTVASNINFHLVHAVRSHDRNAQGVELVEPLTATGFLAVSSVEGGPGQFCFTGMSGVIDAGHSAEVSTASKCRQVPSNSTIEIPFTLSIRSPEIGPLQGEIVGRTLWAGAGAASYPATASLTGTVLVPLPDPITDQRTLWDVILLSLLIPAALWVGLSWWNARFKDPSSVRGYQVEVEVTGLETKSGTPDLNWRDWDFIPPGKPRRLFFRELEIYAPVRILTTQDAVVFRPGCLTVGSLGSKHTSIKGRIAHKIQGQWAFTAQISNAIATDAASITGDLYFFVLDGAEHAESGPDGLIERAYLELCQRFEEIRDHLVRIQPAADDKTAAEFVESPL